MLHLVHPVLVHFTIAFLVVGGLVETYGIAVARERPERFGGALTVLGTIALVPTMGALHAGHVALFDAAHRAAHVVVASVFINPTQFGPNEDFTRYPRTLEADLARCREAKVDVLFAPTREAMSA